jgi:light-regulated signal transduction histidine kinase (bacteriophytochrome)
MVELAERIAAESRERELDALTRQTAAQAAEIRQQTLERRWLQTLAAAALLVLAVATLFLIRLRRAHRTLQAESAQRQAAETEVRALNATLEQQVRERTAQLESANRELEAFSYSVSHDLRAPLRAVDGFSRALLEDHGDRLDEAARAGIDRIRGAARRMSQLVDALLQLARVTRSDLHRAPIDVTALVSSIADELRQREAAPAVDFAIAPNLRASADRRLLLVLFQNLFENACKFSNGRAGARVECGVTTRDGHAAWFVRDNGVGFDMAYAHRLFGPFQRLHSEAEFPGSGIGLATVQRIVHRHGGRIWAESRPGEGATFYFTLPEPVGS